MNRTINKCSPRLFLPYIICVSLMPFCVNSGLSLETVPKEKLTLSQIIANAGGITSWDSVAVVREGNILFFTIKKLLGINSQYILHDDDLIIIDKSSIFSSGIVKPVSGRIALSDLVKFPVGSIFRPDGTVITQSDLLKRKSFTSSESQTPLPPNQLISPKPIPERQAVPDALAEKFTVSKNYQSPLSSPKLTLPSGSKISASTTADKKLQTIRTFSVHLILAIIFLLALIGLLLYSRKP